MPFWCPTLDPHHSKIDFHLRWVAEFQHINNLDTYIWVVCGHVWIYEQTPKRHDIKEIGLLAQNMLTTLGSIANMIGGTYVTT